MSDWQKTILTVTCMAFVLICRMSPTCAASASNVDHIAYVVIGAIWGAHIPQIFGSKTKPEDGK